MIRLLFQICVIFMPIVVYAQTLRSGSADHDVREQSHVTLPFHLLNGYIMMDANVNGIKGKMMFDTGTEFPFFLNNFRIPLGKDTLLGKGKTGSGQEVVIYRQNGAIKNIDLSQSIHLTDVKELPHNNFYYIDEGLDITFLGTCGHGFNRDYEFAINYDNQTIDLYSLSHPARYLYKQSDVLTTIHFKPTGVDGKIPQITLKAGKHHLEGFFDTGNTGTLELTQELKEQLVREGILIIDEGKYMNGTAQPYMRGTLKGLTYNGISLLDVHNLHVTIAQHNRLGMGYQFLKHYVSIWNYSEQTIVLLKR